jgi:serine/threonine protein phosphatase PrpC
MNCPACGAYNREGARFCSNCGASFLEDEVQPSVELEQVLVEETVDEADSQQLGPVEMSPDETLAGAVLAEEAASGNASIEGMSSEGIVVETEQAEGLSEEPVREGGELAGEVGAVPEIVGEQAEVAVETEIEHKAATETVEQGEPGDVPLSAEGPEEDKAAEPELPSEPEDEVFTFWRDEVELMTPVDPSTVVLGRYAVVEALDVQEDEILYRAHDLQRCWQCSFEENDPNAAFCARCGVLMDRRPEVRLLEVRDTEVEAGADRVVVARFVHESRQFLLVAEPVPEPAPAPERPPEPPNIRLLAGQRSDAGQVRELDEDSLFVLTMAPTYESRTGPVLGLFAVADGMGGHAGGEIASKMALRVMTERVMQNVILPILAGELVLEDEILALLRQATIAANDTVYLTRHKRENDMGTTLTTAFIRDDRLFLAHVGDCRVYRWSADGLEQLTTDHSVIASMIAEGQAEPDELFTHPHRSIIYRCIGDKPLVEVDSDMLPLAPGDRVILCCDGLWEMVRDEGIRDIMMQEADPQVASDLLVRHANAAGGDDNISVIVVQVESAKETEESS